jgi:hypothetical protein
MGENVMAQRNLSEEMDDEVVDMLLSEVEHAYPLYARDILRAKAKMLGLDYKMKNSECEYRFFVSSEWLRSWILNLESWII